MAQFNRRILAKNKSVKVYKKVLSGEIKRFPKNYWKSKKNKEDAFYCSIYLIEVILGFFDEDIYRLTKKHFETYMLGEMLNQVYEGDIFNIVSLLYPNKYHSWRFRVPKGYWTKETCVEALKSIVEIEGWDRNILIKKYGHHFIKEVGLSYPIRKIYNYNIYDLLEDAYPGEYKKWELKKVPHNYWNRENARTATRWLIEKLNWDKADIKKNLNKKVFIDYGLGGMLSSVYKNSAFAAINDAYPTKYERFELAVAKGYWTNETCSEAIRFMIEKELKFTKEDVKLKLSKEHFKEYKLIYAVKKVYDGDFYLAIDEAYPGEYRRGELKSFEFREKRINDLVKYICEY